MRKLSILIAVLALVGSSPSTALAADGDAMTGGTIGAIATAIAAVVGLLVQTKRVNDARAALSAGERDGGVGARPLALDAATLHARAKAARSAVDPREACLALVGALEAEAARAECASCTALRAELAAERAEAREELRTNLERILPAVANQVAAGHDVAATLRQVVASLQELNENLRGGDQ